jgi:kynurenine 3-monooxygenase
MRESYDYKVHYSGLGYVEVTIKSTSLDNHCLHYWPRGEFSLFGIPDAENNQFTGDIFLPMEGDGLCFNKFTKETFEAFVKDTFPGLDMVFHLRCDEQGKLKVHQIPNVLVYPWKLGKVCLIGDAAHGMEPFIGQGLNCGLEDCNKLFNLIKQVRDEGLPVDLVQICDQMQKARKE